MTHITTIVLIIVSSGLLGGITNFLITHDFSSTENPWITFWKSIFLGLSAAFTVPLFLQIISNNLLDNPSGTVYPIKNYFILTGFCIIASFYSKRFLEDLYEKVNQAKKEAAEAKKSAKEAEKFIESQLEEEQVSDTSEKEKVIERQVEDLASANEKHPMKLQIELADQDDYKNLLRNFQNSKFRDRSIEGLSKSTKIPVEKVQDIIRSFLGTGIVSEVTWYNKTFYRLTDTGKETKLI